MGLFDFIFGGDKTTVTQKAANTTTVNVTNEINLSALADAVRSMGVSVQGAISQTASQTNELFRGLITQFGSAQVLATIADAQAKAKQNELLKGALDKSGMALKLTALAIGSVYLWRKIL